MNLNKTLQGLLGLLTIVLIVFVGLKARNASLEYSYIGKTGRDTVTVSGEGKVYATPDVAKISVGVRSDATTVADAQKQNSEKMNAIVDALKAQDVDKKDIQTSQYSVQPKIDWSNGKQTILGYTVSQNVDVKVRNLDNVGKILAKAGELGANQVGNIDFVIDDPASVQAQAREKAITDAKEKADVLAKQLGLDVARVVSFSESTGGVVPPRPMMYETMAGKAVDAVAPTIEAGQNEIVSHVDVVFEIR